MRTVQIAALASILSAGLAFADEPILPTPDPIAIVCGLSPSDWCPSPPNDPCGRHKNAEECKADTKCEGIPYVGESLVVCEWDLRCFSSNCPTVGCLSACEGLNAELCKQHGERCEVTDGGTCARKFPCAKNFKVADPKA